MKFMLEMKEPRWRLFEFRPIHDFINTSCSYTPTNFRCEILNARDQDGNVPPLL